MHQEKHFESSDILKDIIIGMSDGLTVPFALAAGLSGAVDSSKIIITAGVAEIIAGSIAMGLGGYLAGRTEFDHYQSELTREYEETVLFPDVEKAEVKEAFAAYGLSESTQQLIADEMSQNQDKWVEFMMKYELGLEKPDPKRATRSALNIGASYVAGGVIPLVPYMIFHQVNSALIASVAVTLIALSIFGYFKSRVIGQNAWRGALSTTLIGALAAAAAFAVAKLFSA